MGYNMPNSYNVGVDVNNYEPVSLEEIIKKFN
jgi:calcineurin-like phosphoesterase family protein